MDFYSIPPERLPEGAQFYHGVSVITVAIAEDIWEEDFDSIWYMEQLTGPRTYAIHIYKEEREYINSYGEDDDDIVFIPDEELFDDIDFEDDEQEEECDWVIDQFDDCVIQIDPDQSISWYRGEY